MKNSLQVKNRSVVPWYRSILFKQALIFLLTLVPILFICIYAISSYRSEALRSIEKTTLSRDSEIIGQLVTNISSMEYTMYNFYDEGDIYLLSDMWNIYNLEEKSQKIIKIGNMLKWLNSRDDFNSSYKIFMLRRGISVYQNGYMPITEKENSIIEKALSEDKIIVPYGGNFYIMIKSLSERNNNPLRFVGMIEIPGYQFAKTMNEIGVDSDTQAVMLINGEVVMRKNTTDASEEAIIDYYRSNSEQLASDDTFRLDVGRIDYFCSVTQYSKYDIVLLTMRTYQNMFSQAEDSIYLLTGSVLLAIIAIAIFLIYISRYINRPIVILEDAFDRLQKSDNETVQISTRSNDEFKVMYDSFNDMSLKLTKYIDDNYKQTIGLQRAELKQLQAQIDPHFLYNTLFILQRRIARKDYKGATELSGLMGSYFRYVNRGGRDFVTLAEEIKHVYVYVSMQNVRFEDRFKFIGEPCPEKFQDVLVPRMILQPLAENSIVYGLKDVEENGVIHIHFGEQEEKILVFVEDSGTITDEQIETMNQNLESISRSQDISSTINTLRRLQLFYGREYKLYFCRSELGGLKAVVELDGRRVRLDADEDFGSR